MKWDNKIDLLKEMAAKGYTMQKIGDIYGVSRQRIYQVFTKYGIETPELKRKNYLRDASPKKYWLNRMLCGKGLKKPERLALLETIEVPDYCPMLGVKLNYNGQDSSGWTRKDNSPSIDQIIAGKGYVAGNIQVISWRANRIKNDSTVEELGKIYNYLLSLQNNC